MSELTREDFASAVLATLTSVHHLYRELNRLISGLKEQLGELPEPLVLFGGTAARSGRDQGRVVVRNDYALLFKPGGADEEDSEDEDEDEEGEEGETRPPRRRRQPAVLIASDKLLAVGIAVYEPSATGSFEPHLAYGVMSDWSIGGKTLARNSKLILARYMLRRIPKAIMGPAVAPGDRVQTTATVRSAEGVKKVADRRLGCTLPAGVTTIPLYELESAASLQGATEAMKQMYRALQRG